MQSVMTKDGVKYLFNERDLAEVIEQNCGSEVAEIVSGDIFIANVDLEDEVEMLHQELRSYEGTCETYSDIMSDVADALRCIVDYIDDAKRLNRNYIIENLNTSIDKLIEEL